MTGCEQYDSWTSPSLLHPKKNFNLTLHTEQYSSKPQAYSTTVFSKKRKQKVHFPSWKDGMSQRRRFHIPAGSIIL
jgi:hypothetical protein